MRVEFVIELDEKFKNMDKAGFLVRLENMVADWLRECKGLVGSDDLNIRRIKEYEREAIEQRERELRNAKEGAEQVFQRAKADLERIIKASE